MLAKLVEPEAMSSAGDVGGMRFSIETAMGLTQVKFFLLCRAVTYCCAGVSPSGESRLRHGSIGDS